MLPIRITVIRQSEVTDFYKLSIDHGTQESWRGVVLRRLSPTRKHNSCLASWHFAIFMDQGFYREDRKVAINSA